MSEQQEREASRAYPDAGRKVWAEKYADDGLMIELGGIDCDEELYLMDGEGEALRDVLVDLYGPAENATKGDENVE